MTRHTRRPLIVATVIMIGFIWLAEAAQAQMVCGKRALVIEQLGEKYGEQQRGIGMSKATGGRIYEIWFSEATGTWTILVTYPAGRTCLDAVGENWEAISPVIGTGT